MSKILWDQTGERLYETGVDHAVLYPLQAGGVYNKGVAWNGITAINEQPSGAESNDLWADNIKYLSLFSAEQFGATIEAYTYPDEFAICDGTAQPVKGVLIGQQTRKTFGLCYRTLVGNDVEGEDYGYKLHFIYGAKASPSEKSRTTINDSPEAVTFSWTVTTTPVVLTTINPETGKVFKPTAYLEIDSTKLDAAGKAKLLELEDILYGKDGTVSYEVFIGTDFEAGVTYYEESGGVYVETTDTTYDSSKTYYTRTETGGTEARLPSPDEIIAFFK